MINGRALPLLRDFIKTLSYLTTLRLVHIPSVFNVLQYELSKNMKFNLSTLDVCCWLYIRGESVRRELVVHPTADPRPQGDYHNIDWKKV